MTADQLDMFTAVRRRNAVLALISDDPRNLPSIKAVIAAIEDTVEPGCVFSANDFRHALPEWVKPHTLGPTLGYLRRKGAVTPVGYVPSTDPGTHGHPVRQWLLRGDA